MSTVYPLNLDFSKPARLLTNEQEWVRSPADGVLRVPLEREANESRHSISFVRFAPGSYFPPHQHPLAKKSMS